MLGKSMVNILEYINQYYGNQFKDMKIVEINELYLYKDD